MTLFTKASKKQSKLRMALLGPAGSGKTYSALRIGRALVGPNGRVALMDTEHGSANKYADTFDFDAFAPDSFEVETYLRAIRDAEAAGYDLLILDSLSHAWAGKGGILEFVDAVAKRQGGNSFGAWRDATPQHNALVEAMLAAKLHLIVTMRVKMEHVQEKDERSGKTVVRKVGLQPVQRDGLEYEFDVVGDLTPESDLVISKTRCSPLRGKVYHEPGGEVAAILSTWLTDGAVADPVTAATFTAPANGAPPTTNGRATHGQPDWARFWAHIKGLGVEHEEAHKVLGVGSLHDWTGSLDEAVAQIERYALARDTVQAQSTVAQPPAAPAKAGKPSTRGDMIRRYQMLIDKADGLGLRWQMYDPQWSDDELRAAGKALATSVSAEEERIFATQTTTTTTSK